MSAELMEDIILIVLHPSATLAVEVATEIVGKGDEAAVLSTDPFSWLKAFSEFERFSLNIRFLSQEVIAQIGQWLGNVCEADEAAVIAARYVSPC
jgi:hypothetical protein